MMKRLMSADVKSSDRRMEIPNANATSSQFQLIKLVYSKSVWAL